MFSVDFTKIGLAAPTKIAKMTTGSSSWNYYIQNKDGEFLIKFLRNGHPEKEKLQKNLKSLSGIKNCPVFLFETTYQDCHVFVFKWVEGKSCFLEKLSSESFKELIHSYLEFSDKINKNKPAIITPFYGLREAFNEIKKPIFFIKKELKEIEKDLSYHPNLRVIHGDFHFKNMIFKGEKLQSFLDFEEFRYGCPTEDLIRLIMTNAEQHNFAREKYTLTLLKQMIEETPYTKEDWLYGLDSFVLWKYRKRLNKRTPRQLFMLFRSNPLYHKIRQKIKEYCA